MFELLTATGLADLTRLIAIHVDFVSEIDEYGEFMRLTILTLGSLGDVRPFVALGVGLRDAGYDVCVATHQRFETLIRGCGLDFAVLAGDPQAILDSPAGHALMRTGENPMHFVRAFIQAGHQLLEQLFIDCRDACRDSSAVLCSVTAFFAAGYHVAEYFGIPLYPVFLQPTTVTREFASVIFPQLKAMTHLVHNAYNRLSYGVTDQLVWQLFRGPTNPLRRKIFDLPSIPIHGPFRRFYAQKHPIIYGYSPTVLPKPSDWGEWLHVTGYWFLDSAPHWQPPLSLADFLSSGPPPVYVGFGSMGSHVTDETTDLIVEALKITKLRAIFTTGWGGLSDAPKSDNIYVIRSIPHDWLFPRVAAVVHHGGQGTTAEALRAGVPSVTIPFFADQPFWGRRVYELGVGSSPIARRHLSLQKLQVALQSATTHVAMRQSAIDLGRRIRQEDGVKTAVQRLQNLIRDS